MMHFVDLNGVKELTELQEYKVNLAIPSYWG